MSYLVDTDVISEISKPAPSPSVKNWFAMHRGQFYLSSVTIGELRRGIERMPASHRKTMLWDWFLALCKTVNKRILSYTKSVAHLWGQHMAMWQNVGKVVSTLDSLIAAMAIHHNFILVTRNISDFSNLGIRLLNPFENLESNGI